MIKNVFIFALTGLSSIVVIGQNIKESLYSSSCLGFTSLENQALLISISNPGWSWTVRNQVILVPSWNVQAGTLRYDFSQTSLAWSFYNSGKKEWSQQSLSFSFAHQMDPNFRAGLRFHLDLSSISSSPKHQMSLDGFGKYSSGSWTLLAEVNRIWQRFINPTWDQKWISGKVTVERTIENHLMDLSVNGSSLNTTVIELAYGYHQNSYLLSGAMDSNGGLHFLFGWNPGYLQFEFGFSFQPTLFVQPKIAIGHVQMDE